MVVARSWRMKKALLPGTPTKDHYELVSEELGQLKDGEIILKTLFITVDPYLRMAMAALPVGSQIPSGQVAKVIESKNKGFAVGTVILSRLGWCDYAKINPSVEKAGYGGIEIAPNIGALSPSLLLGVCGMPGVTAYWGLTDLCKVACVCLIEIQSNIFYRRL